MNPLLKRFNADRKAFERIKKRTESKVARWEYWEWPRWHWEPDSFLEMEPERARKGEAQFGYGRDKQSRVVVAYEFDLADSCKVRAMNFLRYSGDKIIGSHFIPEAIYSGNKVVGNDWAAGGVLVEVFDATLSGGHIV